jgi:hypothetical protein
MMVAVDVVAIGLGLVAWMGRRAAQFRALYIHHINKVGVVSSPKPWLHEVQASYPLAMDEKYGSSVRQP